MKQFVRKDIVQFNAKAHQRNCERAAEKARKELVKEIEQKEECNLLDEDEIDEAKLYNRKFNPIGNIKSKFKQEKIEKRVLKRHVNQQNIKIEKLEDIQTYTIQLFTCIQIFTNYKQVLGRMLDGDESALSEMKKTANIYFDKQKAESKRIQQQHQQTEQDNEEKKSRSSSISSLDLEEQFNGIAEEKFNDILKEYNRICKVNETNINKNNEVHEKNQQFILVPDLDRAANMLFYYPHNNVSSVLYEYELSQLQRIECRAQQDTIYEDDVVNELINYYEIDVEKFNQVNQDRVRNNLSYAEKRKYGMDRQTKKQRNLMKVPEVVKKLKSKFNLIRAVKKLQCLNRQKKSLALDKPQFQCYNENGSIPKPPTSRQ